MSEPERRGGSMKPPESHATEESRAESWSRMLDSSGLTKLRRKFSKAPATETKRVLGEGLTKKHMGSGAQHRGPR